MFSDITFFQLLETNNAIFYSYLFATSLLVGSFLNVVIYRLPLMLSRSWKDECTHYLQSLNKQEIASPSTNDATKQHTDDHLESTSQETFNLILPRSRCPACSSPIKAWQNIPVLSFLLLRGKCHSCKTPINIRYPLLELATALLSLVVAWKFGFSWACLIALLFTWSLICLTMIDVDHQLLPDNITLPLIWLGLIANYFNLFTSLDNALWGAVAGYLSLWSIYWLFKIITKKEGMGYGDFKLLAALGAFLGWKMLLPIILMSSLFGTLVGGFMMLKSKDKTSTPFAFGPFLAVGGWACLIAGDTIIRLLGL